MPCWPRISDQRAEPEDQGEIASGYADQCHSGSLLLAFLAPYKHIFASIASSSVTSSVITPAASLRQVQTL